MKLIAAALTLLLLVVASVCAAGDKDKSASSSATPAESDIKIYKRLIPADVLRGKRVTNNNWGRHSWSAPMLF